jgi:hypothetical protein
MLHALLAERFKLGAHEEDRPRSGYELVVDKGGPKFKEDDPKTNFMGKDARPGLMLFGAFGHGALKGVMTMATVQCKIPPGCQENTTSTLPGHRTKPSSRERLTQLRQRLRPRVPMFPRLNPASLPRFGSR